jgi:hypothetical protein
MAEPSEDTAPEEARAAVRAALAGAEAALVVLAGAARRMERD